MEHDLVAITDEVYEHLTFDGASTSRSRRCPACATARSRSRRRARRSRSRAGRSAGRARRPTLLAAVRTAKQFLTYVNGAPFQHAIVTGLRSARRLLHRVRRRPRARARSADGGAARRGLHGVPPAGHVLRDHRRPRRSARTTAWRSAGSSPSGAGWWRSRTSVFYDDVDAGRTLVRFTFCKRREVLAEAVDRLRTLA